MVSQIVKSQNFGELQLIQVRQLRLENKIVPVYKMVDTCAAEFESETPVLLLNIWMGNESIKSDKESVLVLGSGPIRIGQGGRV